MEANEEVNKVFSLLSEQVIRGKEKDLKILTQHKYRWDAIAPTNLMKLFFISVVFFFVLASIAALTNQITVISGIAISSRIIYLLIAACFLILLEVLWFIRLIKQSKSPQKQLEEDFIKTRNEAVTIEWQMIEDIIEAANFEKDILEYVENKVSYFIEQIQDKAKTTYILVRILAFLTITAIIYIWLPYNTLMRIIGSSDIKVWSSILALLSAVLAGIVLTLQFIFDSALEFQIAKLKKCLYLLEQAKLIINKINNKKESVKSKYSGTKQSLMSKLKNSKIDGPEDFATNLDLYLSGDKRIEPDIR